MTRNDAQGRGRLKSTIEAIANAVYAPLAVLEACARVTPEPVPFAQRTMGNETAVAIGQTRGQQWDCAWFHFTGMVPDDAAGRRVVLLIDLSGEGCVVDAEGTPVLGLTTVSSEFDHSLGRPGKRVVPLLDSARGGEHVDLWVEAGCNDLSLLERYPEYRFGARQPQMYQWVYDSCPSQPATLVASEALVDGPRAVRWQSFQLGASHLTQQMVLTAGSRRLDFVTTVDWHEHGSMLRARFPLAVRANAATYDDIQFGTITRPTHRNTSWDQARFEVCGQKWVDISESGYGVALLNDCKYGHAVGPEVISLNLLRSPSFPDPTADHASQQFTYALYPHLGGHAAGAVGRAGYELNMPLAATLIGPHRGTEPDSASFFAIDAPNVVVETVKQAEDGGDIVVRLYEAQGSTRTRLHSCFPIARIRDVDLMEENAQDVVSDGTSAAIFLAPFEIRTLQLTIGERPTMSV